MIYNKRRCPHCHSWFSRDLELCPICGQEWRRSRQSDICHACGARIGPTDDPCPFCGASRQPGIPRALPRLGRAVMSTAIVALGALLVWWLIPFGAQMGEQAPPTPTSTPIRPTAISLADLLPSPTVAPSPSPTMAPSPQPVDSLSHLAELDVDPLALTPEQATAAPSPEQVTNTPTSPPATPPPEPTATPAPTAIPAATLAPRVHVVQQGDNLNAIARQYGVTAAEIAEANGITLTTILSLDQELVIPGQAAPSAGATPTVVLVPTILPQATAGPPVHIVQQGDTLNSIAPQYGVTAAEIAQANGITLNTILRLGQHLIIPGQEPSAAPAATTEPTGAPGATPAVQRTARPTDAPTPTPMPLRHVVAQGDTLGALAVRYDVSAEEIAEANGISLTTVLRLGQELIIPGETVEPTAAPTPTPEATPTASATPSRTPTNVPIRTPVAAYPYRAPRPLTPINGATFQGETSQPVLQWASVGILAEDEWYLVSLWTPESRRAAVEALTKATFWRVPTDLYPAGRRVSRFDWQVTVIRELDVAPGRVALSPAAGTYWFTWR